MKSGLLFSQRPKRVLHLLLVLSLLFSQGAAYAHVSAHLKTSTDTTGLAGKANQLCSECLEGAPLLGAAGTPHVPTVVQVVAVAERVPTLVCAPVEHRFHYAFRSRAPPAPF